MGSYESGGMTVADLASIRRGRSTIQKQVAADMGVSIATVSRMEDDPGSMTLADLAAYVRALGLTVADVMTVEPVYGRVWTFTVPGVARTKRGAGKDRRGVMHSDPITVDYEQRVAGAATDAGVAAGAGPVAVTLTLYLPTRRRKDADRVTSAVFDGLKRAGKAALEDDNLFVIQRTEVVLGGVDRIHPRAVVTVREIRGIG